MSGLPMMMPALSMISRAVSGSGASHVAFNASQMTAEQRFGPSYISVRIAFGAHVLMVRSLLASVRLHEIVDMRSKPDPRRKLRDWEYAEPHPGRRHNAVKCPKTPPVCAARHRNGLIPAASSRRSHDTAHAGEASHAMPRTQDHRHVR